MPCYDGRKTRDEMEAMLRERAREQALARRDLLTWYLLTPQHHIEQWLCDAMAHRPPSDDARMWLDCHRRFSDV